MSERGWLKKEIDIDPWVVVAIFLVVMVASNVITATFVRRESLDAHTEDVKVLTNELKSAAEEIGKLTKKCAQVETYVQERCGKSNFKLSHLADFD